MYVMSFKKIKKKRCWGESMHPFGFEASNLRHVGAHS